MQATKYTRMGGPTRKKCASFDKHTWVNTLTREDVVFKWLRILAFDEIFRATSNIVSGGTFNNCVTTLIDARTGCASRIARRQLKIRKLTRSRGACVDYYQKFKNYDITKFTNTNTKTNHLWSMQETRYCKAAPLSQLLFCCCGGTPSMLPTEEVIFRTK